MRAAIIREPGQVVIEPEAALPDCGPAEVRVRIEGCGVCGSNFPVWEGRPWFSYPFTPPGAPGHEGWGVVDAAGHAVEGVRVGDRVALLGQRSFAEYDVVAATDVVPVPPSLGERAFPGEPLACAANVFARSDIQPDQHVVIIGIGFLGAVITSLAVRAGARVTAVSRRPWARDLARTLGAADVRAFDEAGDLVAPRVIECVGTQSALDLATQITDVRGRLVIAGYHQDGTRAVNMQLWNWRGIDVVNAHERDAAVYVAGLRTALAAVTEGALELEPLITHSFGLDDLQQAFTLMRERPAGFLKAVVRI